MFSKHLVIEIKFCLDVTFIFSNFKINRILNTDNNYLKHIFKTNNKNL